ncbi:MAG: hypothetical protein PUD96_04845 [Coriobacteriaceae bacterium]|nr:hypothetical protein [Coriobacteriaceae bacterium]
MRFVRREVAPRELAVAGGIPVMNAARTVLDLVADGEDLSLVSMVLRDALDMGMVRDEASLASAVDELGHRQGIGIPQGESLRQVEGDAVTESGPHKTPAAFHRALKRAVRESGTETGAGYRQALRDREHIWLLREIRNKIAHMGVCSTDEITASFEQYPHFKWEQC